MGFSDNGIHNIKCCRSLRLRRHVGGSREEWFDFGLFSYFDLNWIQKKNLAIIANFTWLKHHNDLEIDSICIDIWFASLPTLLPLFLFNISLRSNLLNVYGLQPYITHLLLYFWETGYFTRGEDMIQNMIRTLTIHLEKLYWY